MNKIYKYNFDLYPNIICPYIWLYLISLLISTFIFDHFGSLSDIRLKKDIKDYSYDISKFKQFKPKSFNWINPEVHGDKSNVKGFIAQDIELVDKDWVEDSWIRDDDPDYDLVKETSTKNGLGEDVGISKISKFGYKDAMYISVIQQLISRIETLESS